ncbi:MAG TPA: ribose-phosphate pyrophosphokinase [Firmicutes bacterium]|jgi:ribose-phosphate pyrophosphokinase|nr:ribose-phosphate pyrophosphokinase [Bacillota bacterium]
MGLDGGRIKIFSGSANPELAREICNHIGLELGACEIGRFSNGEIKIIVNESVRGCDIFIIQPTSAPVNDTLMELLIMADALRRASARRITAVLPYYGYARQDRKTRGREPISAKLVANLITVAGARRVLTMDLHAGQIQGFFDIPVDHLTAAPILADYFARKNLSNVIVVSPDAGGVTRARDMADRLGATIGFVNKRRPEPNVAEVMNVVGDVRGKTVIVVDDIIDTGGTLVRAGEALMQLGAREIYACGTHAILSGPAVERLSTSVFKELVVTNTMPVPPEKQFSKLTMLSVAPLFGEAIIRIHEDLSVSKLFD